MDYETLQKIIKEKATGEWIPVDDHLPEPGILVFVKRDIKLDDFVISTEDIGVLTGTGDYDRWELLSQEDSILPLTPMLCAKIVTHWMEIPKKEDESAS